MTSRNWHGQSPGGYCDDFYPCCYPYLPRGRSGLEGVFRSLSRPARRDLATVMKAIDSRVFAATYGDEPDAPGWWDLR